MSDIIDIQESSASDSIKVSVVMPVYNACKYIRPALDSILAQTLKEIEIICVDDGSTDTSLDMVKIYRESDPRIRILTETNAGPALARNNGLRRARGEYVIFLDADDFFEPTLLERLYDLAKERDLDIAISKYDIFYSKKGVFASCNESEQAKIFETSLVTSKNEYPDQILQSVTGAAWNKLFRRRFLEDNNISFLTDVMMFEDVYFTVTAMAFAERVAKIGEVLVHHRLYNDQSRATTFKKYYAQVPEVYLKIKEFLMKGGMYHPLAKGYLNLSATRCYRIFDLLGGDDKAQLWTVLHNEYAKSLGWCEHAAEDFECEAVAEFCINVCTYNYAQYKRRSARATRGGMRGLFARIFSKNKEC